MIRREAGFSLVELLITMVIFVFVIAATSNIFVGLINQFKQQSKIAETNIEGIVGLDIMRQDIESVGYGLPWVWVHAALSSADEAVNDAATSHDDTVFNDIAVDDVPRAVVSGDSLGDFCQGGVCSDVLVIKATNVARNEASQKWTYVSPGNTVKVWDIPGERFANNDRAIVISLGNTDTTLRTLVLNGGSFTATYVAPNSLSTGFAPADTTDTRIVYGIDGAGGALRMPFNRADYYVRTPAAPNMPTRCAAGTGVLYKATVSQADGSLFELPLLDCVADMQVYYRLDTNNDGAIESEPNSLAGLTAADIRNQLREVRVYVLAHEGQRDTSYTFSGFTPGACSTCVRVGQSATLGRDFNLSTITDYLNYRWKVYTIVVQPKNLR